VEGITYLVVATEYVLYETIGNINVCTESELLKVEVPVVFLGTVGFSLRRDGRYVIKSHFYTIRHHPDLPVQVLISGEISYFLTVSKLIDKLHFPFLP
jgi:hypothetical protein